LDSDAMIIIILFLILLVLTIGSLIGLSKKIWASAVPTILKILAIGLLLLLLIIGLFKFDTVDTGKIYISTAEIIVLSASFVIALNWSINISRKISKRTNKIKPYITIPVLTIAFSFLIPFSLYWLGILFDKLNLMGSGG
jgi:hypothetical protein